MALTKVGKEGVVGLDNSADATAITIDSSERVMIGTTTEGEASADDLTVAGSANTGITIRAGTSNSSSIYMSDATSGTGEYAGYIAYSHSANSMSFGTNAGSSMTIDSTGAVTKPKQPAFLVQPSTPQSNFGADGNNDTIAFGTERFDQGSDFASNTFTAPVTGKYQLSANIYLTNIDSAADYYQLTLYTSNRSYYYAFDVSSADSDPNRFTFQVNVLADMDASDQAFVMILQVNGTAQTDIAVESYFSGCLVC